MEKAYGWQTMVLKAKVGAVRVLFRRNGPFGVAKISKVRCPLPWDEINKFFRLNRIVRVTLELLDCNFAQEVRNQGFRPEKAAWVTKTVLIDLIPEQSQIMASFNRARSWIRKLGPRPVRANDFDLFYDIWTKAARSQRLWSAPRADYNYLVKAFGQKCFCLTIEGFCGVLILTHAGVAYYYYSVARPQAKAQNLPYLLVWEAMLEAKRRGCRIWDFEGIYDSRFPRPDWQGFSQFKKTFGGEVIDYPGTFTRWSWGNLFGPRL